MNGADDILAFLNNTPVLIPSESVDNSAITNSWQNTSTVKDEVVQTIPIVILDDGQIAFQCNGQYFIMGGNDQEEEAIESELTTSPAVNINASEFLSSCLPNTVTTHEDNLSISVPKSEQTVEDSNANEEIDVDSVDCEGCVPVDSTNNMVAVNDWVQVDKLKEVFPAFGLFKCLSCQFTTESEESISSHVHSEFVIISHVEPPPTKVNSKDPLESTDYREKFLYLCSQCSDVFDSLNTCREHMIKDHNMIFSMKEKLQPLPLKPIDINSGNVEKCNVGSVGAVSSNSNGNTGVESIDEKTDETVKKASAENVEQKVKFNGKSRVKSLKVDPDYHVRPFKCKHVSCVLRFPSSEALAQHTACHKGPNRREYACSQCGSKFDEWRHCSLHLWNTHNLDVDLYTCGVCGQHKTTSRLSLETHMKIHRDVKEFACPECGKRFKQKAQLRNHRITHFKKNDSDSAEQPPRWYMTQKCHICFKMYADSKCLKKHIQAVHSKLRPYVCQVCGHSSARKAMLQAHLRQHTGEKPYACPTCAFRTGDHNSLRRHIMRHSGERPYKCPHCSYASIQSTCFKNHLQIRHPGKGGAYACVRCTFTTVSHSSFLQHLSDHKNNLIPSDQSEDVKVFPENVAAAQLVYQCLGACPPGDGSRFQADVTARSTSDDGTKQTITIEIPTNSEVPTTDDEDTANCFLHSEEVDTGGITIPADPTEPILVNYT